MTAPSSTVCALCGTPGAARACALCGTPHHEDCWQYGGGCSIFGCAGATSCDAGKEPRASGTLIEIDESTPAPRPPSGFGLIRRLRRDSGALPRTVGTSLSAALLAAAGLLGTTGVWAALVLTPAVILGLTFGVIAAYAGRTLHRSPLRAGVLGVGGAAAITLAVGLGFPSWMSALLEGLIGDVRLPFTRLSLWGTLVNLCVGGILVGVLVAAVAASEAWLGPRSAFGQRAVRASSLAGMGLRLGTTGALVFGFLQGVGALLTAILGYSGPAGAYLAYAPQVATALTLVAWPALEQGKEAYLAKLPPSRRELPPRSP